MPDAWVPIPETVSMLDEMAIDSLFTFIVNSCWLLYSAAEAVTVFTYGGVRFSLFTIFVAFLIIGILFSLIFSLVDEP